MDKQLIMQYVEQICNMESTDCRSLNKADVARKLMNLASIPQEATIQEIPVDWGNAVVINFLIPNDTNYYNLFAGIGNDKRFYFELNIDGILKEGNHFDFYDEPIKLSINHFVK
ncbi:hypothetical protein [Anaerovorax sp. IOR16]|uniref:hypothetical protein n=1 Tax=Anaerovorax sp. IOR16 TaxID=2773458 RepID=UPI0019CF8AA5|nr:hypothetical protein [Anaerovorax sp. IOR16]